jgi:hypothetical protein
VEDRRNIDRRNDLSASNVELIVVDDAGTREYKTMTVDGSFGSTYVADSVDRAIGAAQKDGYVVMDVMDDILVIEG